MAKYKRKFTLKTRFLSPAVCSIGAFLLAAFWFGCQKSEAGDAKAKAADTKTVHTKAPVQGPEMPPTSKVVDTTAKPDPKFTMNYKITLSPIWNANTPLPNYQNQELLIFYFSATCPHCQHAFPFVQAAVEKETNNGLKAIAVASGSNQQKEIEKFIKDAKVHMPVYQDSKRELGNAYGNGYVPIVMLIDKKGNLVRYTDFDENVTPEQIIALVDNWHKSK